MLPRPKVIIVGAGAAGIAAASKLMASNLCSVTILEAENRIGGRVCTSSFGEGIVELGAQWVHGEKNNIAHSLGTSAGLLSHDSYGIRGAKCVLSDGSILPDEDADKLFLTCIEVAHDEQKLANFKGSLGDYFIESIKEKFQSKGVEYRSEPVEGFLDWYHRFQNSIDGSDSWFQTSASGLIQYEECEGNSVIRWNKGGYKNIFSILMGNNSKSIRENIIFNKKVQTISWGQHPLEVICSDGQKFTADHVLVTVSLGVLKENHSNMFQPKLTSKKINAIQKDTHYRLWAACGLLGVMKNQEILGGGICRQFCGIVRHYRLSDRVSLWEPTTETALVVHEPATGQVYNQGLSIGTVDKIFIKFPHRWWPLDSPGFSLIWKKSDFQHENEAGWMKEVFGFYSVDDNPDVLCGWVVGTAARHMEQCSDDQVKETCYQLLRNFLGAHYEIPPPDSILRSTWHTNPNFRGSYSFRSLTTEEKNAWAADLASPLPQLNNPLLLFGGEATHDHFYSTVHGAIETGRREADRLISHFNRLPKSSL